MAKPEAARVIIQVEQPGTPRPDLAAIAARLAGTGVVLDESYGPIAVDPTRGRYVVRGAGTPEALARLRALPGVRVFGDAPIAPTSD